MCMTVTISMPPRPRHMAACGVQLAYLNTRDRTVQAHVSAVMFAQPTAGPPILASKLTACPAFAEADHYCRANLFTPELLVISKSGCQHKVETSAALTNLDVVYVVRTTLMTHVTPEGRSRRGFPCSVTSPKSSSNATHAWRAVGRAGGLGLLQNESVCAKKCDAVLPRATKRTQARGPTAAPQMSAAHPKSNLVKNNIKGNKERKYKPYQQRYLRADTLSAFTA
ncbi:hypothetical protein EDB83DRAFT_2313164 [Lactarius deliciosus]|nr:hypothetical protein EDB83DRAFT_2313164 [Lactarius deliciosus]